jgi:methionyl-tRNA synthetase
LNLTNDDFIRTTEQRHIQIAQKLWQACDKNGDIYKKRYKGLYCVGCESFISRGALVNGLCPNHKTKPEEVEEENYFFALSKYTSRILKLLEENLEFVQPQSRYNEIKSLCKAGLEDISISRPKEKLSWGISVPDDPSQVMYVWFDALSNYLNVKDYWPAQLHIIGKDILRFHAALWPAMLMSASEKLPEKIYVHGFISVEGQKMSKSLGNVIYPQDLIDKFGTDATRYLLMAGLNFDQDSDFSYERFSKKYNTDLANDLGNLVQRTLTMAKKYNFDPEHTEAIESKETDQFIEKLSFKQALESIFKIVIAANQYIDKEKPWDLTEDNKKLEEVLTNLFESLKSIARDLSPFMPATAEQIEKQISTLNPKPLFPKI